MIVRRVASSAMTRQWAVLAEHGDFRRLFAASSVSLLGSSVTTVALPLTAVVYLNASPAQMGVLGAAGFLPHLVLGLPAGVWVNRWPYRRLLVSADLMQMLLLGVVPVLAVLAVLRIWELYVVVVLAGVCALFDAVAAQSLTPMLVPRPRLLAANSVLALSNSTVSTTGAALGGALVQALTAPVAIAVDAASFLFSAVCKTRIGAGDAGETSPMRTDRPRQHLLQQILDGLRAVFGDPVVRAATVSATLGALAGQMQAVVVVLFLVRTLHLSSALVGVVIAVAGAAGILGAAVGVPITERIGHGPAFIMGMLLASAAGLIMASANGSFAVVLVVLIVAQTLRGCGPSLYGLNQQTIRQAFIPRELMSRAQATWRFLVYGTQPIGALLGGLLASTAGLRATLITSSIGMLAATIVALASQLRKLRTLPEKAVRPSR